ncbi:MAG: hypothetical protein ACOH2H_24070 [Cypionkella sp.]
MERINDINGLLGCMDRDAVWRDRMAEAMNKHLVPALDKSCKASGWREPYRGCPNRRSRSAVQKIIHATNSIAVLKRIIRKSIKMRGSFPTEEAARKLIRLAIRNFETGGRSISEWFVPRRPFAAIFKERVDA